MSEPSEAESVVRAFLDAFARADLAGLRVAMADDFVALVTTADGGTRTASADDYVVSVEAMDVPTAGLQLAVKDVTAIGPDRVLVMVEVHAARNGRTLHNFSGQLATVRDGRIAELSMVDALPEESDEFWSA